VELINLNLIISPTLKEKFNKHYLTFHSFFHESTGGSTNLMGKFTQSVRRIVQDVKDEGTMSGLSREEVIEINERLILFRYRLELSYETAKQALNALMGKYGDSKSQRNIFHRYPLLKIMIKVSELKYKKIFPSFFTSISGFIA
jgi:tRNA U54 and U55 pseudouridine synthase Pus10